MVRWSGVRRSYDVHIPVSHRHRELHRTDPWSIKTNQNANYTKITWHGALPKHRSTGEQTSTAVRTCCASLCTLHYGWHTRVPVLRLILIIFFCFVIFLMRDFFYYFSINIILVPEQHLTLPAVDFERCFMFQWAKQNEVKTQTTTKYRTTVQTTPSNEKTGVWYCLICKYIRMSWFH